MKHFHRAYDLPDLGDVWLWDAQEANNLISCRRTYRSHVGNRAQPEPLHDDLLQPGAVHRRSTACCTCTFHLRVVAVDYVTKTTRRTTTGELTAATAVDFGGRGRFYVGSARPVITDR